MSAWSHAVCLLALTAATGCYGRAEASRDTNRAWVGQSRAALEAEWGAPTSVETAGERTALRYVITRTIHEAESPPKRRRKSPPDRYHLSGLVNAAKGAADFVENLARKKKRRVVIDAESYVLVDPGDQIVGVAGPSVRWGPPDDENMRWGTILGMHVGLGTLDDTATPLPSGGAYLGGMLSRTLGLVGTFSLASGRDDAGGAMALGWGIAPQYWVSTRFSLRAGPEMILAYDPGFADVSLEPGVSGGLSFAALKAGTFVLDLRLDINAGTKTRFATAGVGVNLN